MKTKVILVQIIKKLPEPHWAANLQKGFIFPVVQHVDPRSVTAKAKAETKKFWHVLHGQYNYSPVGMLPEVTHKSACLLLKTHCKIVGKYDVITKK